MRRSGVTKRAAQFVPQGARSALMGLSKATLAELVWDFATIAQGEGGQDAAEVLGIVAEHDAAVARATGQKPARILAQYRKPEAGAYAQACHNAMLDAEREGRTEDAEIHRGQWRRALESEA